MKEIKQNSIKNYPPASFYKEDIIAIIDIFENDLDYCEIIIGKYQIKNKDDIDTIRKQILKEEVDKFSIKYQQYFSDTKTSRYLTLEIDGYLSRIYVSDSSDNYTLGLMSKIDKIILEKKSIRRTLMRPKVYISGTLILLIVSLILDFTIHWEYPFHSILTISLAVLTFFPSVLMVIWLILRITTKKTNVIYLINSQDRTSFFKRNKDQIILALTFGLIGTILGAVIGSILTVIILNAIYPPKP
jgi:hypothetical protein